MSKTSTIHETHLFVSSDPRWALIQRVAASQHLKTSIRLRDFLLYVGECAIRDVPEECTEQQIGIHVFERAPGYNSSEDSIVRTHARLLRQKLGEYFAGEGSAEQTIVEIPKGHYLPIFHAANSIRSNVPSGVVVPPPSASASRVCGQFKGVRPKAGVAIIVFILLGLCGFYFWKARPEARQRSAVEIFWRPFLHDDPPLVIYSNALFVGDSKNGLRYAREPQPILPDSYIDTYTGIGEVASVYQLTRLFDAEHARFILKRSLLVTWDEAKLKNLIFIGSQAENPSLKVLPTTTDFTMMTGPDFAGIVNHHPRPGEPSIYSRPEHPLNKDYAILALLPGMQEGKWILICSGLTTFGTQAAVEYVSHPDTVAELLRPASLPNGRVRPFEAVLETTIAGGVPMETKLVTIRVH